MSSVMDKVAQLGLTREQAERAQQRADSLLKQASEDPALYKELMEKLGLNPWGGMKRIGRTARDWFPGMMGQTLALTAAGAAVGGGAHLARAAVDATTGSIGKAKAYQDMMEARPELREKDPKAVQRAFDSLYRFNPQYAKDPLVAGSFVDSVSSNERLDVGTVNTLVAARKNLSDTGMDISKAFPRHSIVDPEEQEMKMEKLRRP